MVAWPYDGMTQAPTHFNPERPNPVPGKDQSRWGYPVTLQLGRPAASRDSSRHYRVTMTLFEGNRNRNRNNKRAVDCHFSSPELPSNPEHAPKRTYCLIPKRRLASGKTYTVVARFSDDDSELVWQFTTK